MSLETSRKTNPLHSFPINSKIPRNEDDISARTCVSQDLKGRGSYKASPRVMCPKQHIRTARWALCYVGSHAGGKVSENRS